MKNPLRRKQPSALDKLLPEFRNCVHGAALPMTEAAVILRDDPGTRGFRIQLMSTKSACRGMPVPDLSNPERDPDLDPDRKPDLEPVPDLSNPDRKPDLEPVPDLDPDRKPDRKPDLKLAVETEREPALNEPDMNSISSLPVTSIYPMHPGQGWFYAKTLISEKWGQKNPQK